MSWFGQIPTPIKIKLALPVDHPPLPRNPKPPLPKRRNCMGIGFSSRKSPKMPGANKIGTAIYGPRVAGGKISDMRLFLIGGRSGFFFVLFCLRRSLVALHCALQRDYLSDIPTSCTMGFWWSQDEDIWCKAHGTTWKQGKMSAISPLRYYLKKALGDIMGGGKALAH